MTADAQYIEGRDTQVITTSATTGIVRPISTFLYGCASAKSMSSEKEYILAKCNDCGKRKWVPRECGTCCDCMGCSKPCHESKE